MNDKIKKIKLIAFDVDGVFISQSLLYWGGEQISVFCCKDGSACSAAIDNGIIVALISGRQNKDVEARAMHIGIKDVYLGKINKNYALEDLKSKYNIAAEEICFVSDDFFDIPILKKVGFPCCPADADEDVKKICLYHTKRKGGDGAVADVIRIILTNKFGDSVFGDFANKLWKENE